MCYSMNYLQLLMLVDQGNIIKSSFQRLYFLSFLLFILPSFYMEQSLSQPQINHIETDAQSLSQPQINDPNIQPKYKLLDIQANIRSILKTQKMFFEQHFKSMCLRKLNSMIKIKQTEIRVIRLKQQSNFPEMTDKLRADISFIENEIDLIKIQLINSIKATVKLGREVNRIYNRWFAQVVDLMILPIPEIKEMTDLPLKLLQEHYLKGLPNLLIESNILSPYLKKIQKSHKKPTENCHEKLENQNQSAKLSIERTVQIQAS